MIRRRHFTPALRRRLAELDEKPGLDPDVIEQQAAASRRRMAVIDSQPDAWRSLLNDYPHQQVAALAETLGTPEAVRRALERKGRA